MTRARTSTRILAALAAVVAAACLPMAPAWAMSQADYDAAISRCDPIAGDKQALCTEKVNQQRDIEAREARRQSGVVTPRRRSAAYYVEMKKCNKLVGDPQALCSEAAKQKWPLVVKPDTTPKDAATVAREAQYAAAMKKCDPIAGDKRALCTEAAMQDFGAKP